MTGTGARSCAILATCALCLIFTGPIASAQQDDSPLGRPAQEKAVAVALRWLAEHQQKDGGWSFAAGEKDDAKVAAGRTEATSLALLAFLGARQTHKEGAYKKQTWAGFAFLIKQMKVDERAGDLRGTRGDMASHGIAAKALCEGYALTHDKELLAPAQLAINFIVKQQDKESGGWRADAMAKPSVEVTGWQLLALKSAHMAYLQVPLGTVKGANKYLDAVQLQEGRAFPGANGRREHRATAVGLYCRMMLGMKGKHPVIKDGLAAVGREGPQKNDVIANYFAHQLQQDGLSDSWKPWNEAMVKQLLETQIGMGDDVGSWHEPMDASGRGRLLQTAINAMILETSLLGSDLMRKRAQELEDEFPL